MQNINCKLKLLVSHHIHEKRWWICKTILRNSIIRVLLKYSCRLYRQKSILNSLWYEAMNRMLFKRDIKKNIVHKLCCSILSLINWMFGVQFTMYFNGIFYLLTYLANMFFFFFKFEVNHITKLCAFKMFHNNKLGSLWMDSFNSTRD